MDLQLAIQYIIQYTAAARTSRVDFEDTLAVHVDEEREQKMVEPPGR